MTGVLARMVGVDLGPLGVGPTPVAVLVAVLVVGVIMLAVLVLGSQAAGPLVDRRWPANEPLTPSEVLWAETGSHVAKTFPGLDPVLARDLIQYVHVRKVGPGTVVVEAGDLPTEFVVLKSGSAEVLEPSGTRAVKAGATFGSDNILRRLPHQATVRTTSAAELVTLDAQDYLAAVALGMSDDDDDYVVHALAGVLGADTTPGAPAAPGAPGFAPPAPPRWGEATHTVVRADLPGYVLPAGEEPTRQLAVGTQVAVVEDLPGWAHVRTADGWVGWVETSGIAPR